MKLLACTCAVALLLAPARGSDAAQPAEPSDPPMEEVLVAAEYPGPGLWKVSKPDSEHVLWIFGALGAEPRTLKWKSRQVEKVVAESQEIIHAEGLSLTFEEKVGVFTMLRLLPTALKARKNPDDKTLEDVLPADVYARWRVLKAQYIGGDGGIERWRPFMAAERLRDKASGKLRDKFSEDQWAVIGQLVREHKLRVTMPTYEVKIPNEKLRSSMKTFLATPMDDVGCLDVTMRLVEFWGDDAAVSARAIAWAKGNLPALRALPPLPDPDDLCMAALLDSQAVQDLHLQGLEDIGAGSTRVWMDAIEKAFAGNASTLAILPIEELLRDDGRLALLREMGYRIEDPV